MVKVRQNLMPSSLYSWKSPYSMTPTRIVVHNTANDASADSEIRYMNKSESEGGRQTSFHYAVDDKEAVQGLPENRNGWHSGDGGNGKGNRQGIAIEICYSKSGGDRFIKAEQNAVELIVDILKRYGWGIDKVTKHQDYANKYCPHRTLDMGWDRFINMIKDKLNTPASKPTTPSTPSTTLKYSKGDKIVLNGYLYRDSYGNGQGSKKTNYKGTITKVNEKGTKPYHIDSIGWVAENDITKQTSSSATESIKVGDKVRVKQGAKSYEGANIASFVFNNTYRVDQLKGSRAVLDLTGICTAFNVKDLIKQ